MGGITIRDTSDERLKHEIVLLKRNMIGIQQMLTLAERELAKRKQKKK